MGTAAVHLTIGQANFVKERLNNHRERVRHHSFVDNVSITLTD